MNPQSNEIDKIIASLLVGEYAWVESELSGTSHHDKEIEVINKRGDEAKAKLEALIRARQIEARVDELNLAEKYGQLRNQDEWLPQFINHEEYIAHRVRELKGKEK